MCDCHESKRVFFDSTGSMRFSSQLRMQYDLPEICLAPRKGNVEKWLMEVQGSADMVDMFEMKTTDATFHADMKWLLNPNVFSMRPSCSLSFSNLTELPTGSMIDSLTKVTAASLLAYAKNERRGLKISLIVMLALGHFNGTTTVLHLVLPISALLSDTVGIHWSHSLKSKRIHIPIYIYIYLVFAAIAAADSSIGQWKRAETQNANPTSRHLHTSCCYEIFFDHFCNDGHLLLVMEALEADDVVDVCVIGSGMTYPWHDLSVSYSRRLRAKGRAPCFSLNLREILYVAVTQFDWPRASTEDVSRKC